MVTCKKCGYVGEYTQEPCPLCHSEIILSDIELKDELDALRAAVKNKEYKLAADGYRKLAEDGYTEAQKEYANILEKGVLVPTDFALATEYFYKAAKKNDAYAAYRYSRLVSRESDEASLFWLLFSAVLGCVEAYPLAADELSKRGFHGEARHFYSLAAACDDVESIVKLARIYFDGIGTPKAPEYAKWYMDKLRIPPIYAIKLAYNLRSFAAREPLDIMSKDYDGLLFRLKSRARELGFGTAYFKISEILAERGDADSIAIVGDALIQGNGCEQNLIQGLKMLTKAAALNNVSAHLSLAALYSDGKYTGIDMDTAISHYNSAGLLGRASAYEAIGDIYANGIHVDSDVEQALEYYDLAIRLGSLSALRKTDGIKEKRISLYNAALVHEEENPEEAFALYAEAGRMGHVKATYRLAVCFEFGIGTEINRHGAFLLYKKAAELGEDAALLSLGICYAKGIGTKLDFKLAKDALSKAERLGISGAEDAIRTIMECKKSKLAKRYYSTAMRLIYMKKFDESKSYLEIAAQLSNPRAIYTLGCLYEFGIGAPCDKDKAYDLYEHSYSLFFRDPRSRYKLAVLRMLKAGNFF